MMRSHPRSTGLHTFAAAMVLLLVSSAGCGPQGDEVSSRAEPLTGFTTLVDYQTATIDTLLINFNGSPNMVVDGASIAPGIVTFGSPEADEPTTVIWSSDAITDAGSTVAVNGVGPISGTFAAPVSAFGFNVLSGSEPGTVDIFDAGGMPLGTFAVPDTSGGFFGVVSGTPIGSFVLRGGIFPETGGRDRLFIDNLRLGRTPAEAVAALCPCEGPATGGTWKNHGHYVSCVAHAASALLEAGEITEAEKGAIVSSSARSNCGKKARP